ncbi:MAG: hypothetical protein HYX68_04235 [Planctomycetes bacterium]|nr:hypothetical protein [Planctomycetota bacterium]
MAIEASESAPPEVMAELREAAAYAVKGVRDPAVMKRACEEMDRLRAKNAKLYPGADVGVDIIREMRDSRTVDILRAALDGK